MMFDDGKLKYEGSLFSFLIKNAWWRTLDWWRTAHIGFYAREGWDVDDDTVMVLERFDLVWPLSPRPQLAGGVGS